MLTTTPPTARIDAGRLRGEFVDGIARFRGVPFAQAPFGERRFGVARPPQAWEGERDATRAGVGYVQPRLLDDPWNGYLNPSEQGEDMLTLEVCTPEPGPGARLPVMVWIHGGGFTEGVGSAPAHSGLTFARDGVVHVSVNYRMGLDGFGLLEDSVDSGTENLGLRDQLAALQWVQRNIEAFGGDPRHVTIAGQSAGAISVLCLMGSPLASGLFSRAIVESGFPGGVRELAQADAARTAIARAARRPAARSALRDLDLDATRDLIVRVVRDFNARAARGRVRPTDLPFMITVGTASVPEPPTVATTRGIGADVPLLIGTARDEMAGLLAKAGILRPLAAPLHGLVRRRFGVPSGISSAYRGATRAGAGTAAVLSAAVTDAVARIPAIRLAESRPAATHLYEFAWQSPGLPEGLGADHVVDVPFMRDDLDAFRRSCPAGDDILGEHPPQALATAMHGAFVDFVRTGDPGWAPYEPTRRATMRFDADSAVVDDLAGAERLAWSAR